MTEIYIVAELTQNRKKTDSFLMFYASRVRKNLRALSKTYCRITYEIHDECETGPVNIASIVRLCGKTLIEDNDTAVTLFETYVAPLN